MATAYTLLISCSAEKKLAKRLVGEWNIVTYSEQFNVTAASEVTLTNIGKLTLDRDGTGDKSIHFSLMSRTVTDTLQFRWSNTVDQVTIMGSEESMFTKTWLVMSDKKKEQVWKSTDNAGNSQRMVLRK
jgi:hypothetical protein